MDQVILYILSMSTKEIAKICIQNCVRFSVYKQDTTLYRIFKKCDSTVLPLNQNVLIF